MKKVLMHIVWLQSLAASASADVRLPNLFSDIMVLQRDKVIKVREWADPEEKMKVVLSGRTAEAKADASGEWRVDWPAIGAGWHSL